MKIALLVIAITGVGATIGVMHALSVSPTSLAVLEILAAIVAGVVGLLASKWALTGNRSFLRQTNGLVAMVIAAVISGYWGGWISARNMTTWMDMPGQSLTHLSARDRVDAYRLMAINEELGVPRTETLARILELMPANSTNRSHCAAMTARDVLELADIAYRIAGAGAGGCGQPSSPHNLQATLASSSSVLASQELDAGNTLRTPDSGHARRAMVDLSVDGELRHLADGSQSGTCAMPVSEQQGHEFLIQRLASIGDRIVGCNTGLEAEIERVLWPVDRQNAAALRRRDAGDEFRTPVLMNR